MKQKTLLNLWLLLCLMLFGGGNSAWADDTYILGWGNATGTTGTYTNFTSASGSVSGILSFTTSKNSSANDPAYNLTNKQLRLYYASNGKGGSITLTPASGIVITGAVIKSATTPSVKYSVDGGTATSVSQSSKVYTISGISATTSLTIQNVNTTNTQFQISTIEITYETASSTYSVTYDGNGSTSGSVPEDDKEYDKDDKVTVLGNTGGLAKAGYAFGGWNTENDGTGTTYDADDTFTITSSTTLYAKWNPYSLSATSSNNSHGTVSVLDYVISAEPSSNYRVVAGDGGYTVTSGTATVVNNGDNTFTVTPSTDCTVQINFEEIPTHEITISTPTGGTLTVKNGDDDVSSGSSVREGTTLTIIPEEDNSHKFAKWTATVGNTSTDYTDVFTYTVPASDFTLSATFDEVVKYAVNWSVNGNVTTEYYQKDEDIVFPDDIADINGKKFVGWYGSTYENASTAPTYVTSATMGTSALTYYAVFADVTEEESDDVEDAKLAQTLLYDTWTKGGTSSDQTTYRLFGNTGYVESSAFDLSKLIKVIVYGGTYGGDSYNSLTIGDGTNTWKSVTVSGKTATGTNPYTGGTALSGTKALRVTSTCGNGSSNGVRISKVEIYVKGTIVTKKNFNTTVSLLPIPVITVSDVEMTWGDDDKSIAASATIDEESYDGSFTYECEDDDLTIESDGSLSCDEPGEYEVTVSIAATEDHQAASKTITVTVNKKDITLSFDNDAIIKMTTDETKTFTATATADPAAYDGTISYAISGSGSATINTSTGAVTYTTSTGVNTITATAPATSYYNGNTATYTLYVKTTPTITVSNQTLAYGATYTPTITGGTASISTVPANMATMEDGVITAAAVGTATVTVSTEATDTYVAGEESFTLTVTAPTALAATPTPSPVVLLNETFNNCNSSGGNDGTFNTASTSSMTNDNVCDNEGWTGTMYPAKACVKLGGSSTKGSCTTPALGYAGTLTLSFKAAAWSGDATENALVLSVDGDETLNTSTFTLKDDEFTQFEVTISNATTSTKVKFSSASASKNRFYLDEVKVTRPGDPIESVAVTIPSSGLGTYCSLYPLDFSDTGTNDNNFKAYVVTGIDGNNITLQKLTTEVKGGVPFVIVGEGSSQVEIPTADNCSYVPSNELVGTLAPTYVTGTTAGYTNYGMSGGKFKKINTGIVPANRAYLPIADAEAREFNLVFLDDEVTGIRTIDNGKMAMDKNAVYDLSGRRVQNPKHGLYIVNGKKVIIK